MSNPPEGSEILRHRSPRRLRLPGIIALCVVALVVTVGLVGRSVAGHKLRTWTQDRAISTVDIVRPTLPTGDQTLVLPGQVAAFYDASIHARVNGYLKKWYTDIGAPVKAGQVLAIIDTPDLDQQLVRAQADLETAQADQRLAKTTADRWTGLLAKDAVSKQETDEKVGDLAAKSALVNAARAHVDQLRAEESFKRIVAPFDGLVTARTTDIGALISAGTPNDPGLFTVSDVHKLRIYVRVPQIYSSKIAVGTTASLVAPDYPGQAFQAAVSSTSGAVGDRSGALLVELQMDNAQHQLKPGDYVEVHFALPASGGMITIPASATMFLRSGESVAVVGPNNRIIMKPITVGVDDGAEIQVSAGLTPTDRVVDNPPDSLAAGDLVRIAGASAQRIAGARQAGA